MAIEKLIEIKKKLDRNEKVDSTYVRTFLSWFGVERRGWWVVQEIKRQLNELEIETLPDFNAVYIDSLIEFRKIEPKSKEIVTNLSENISDKGTDGNLEFNDPTFRISRLEAANKDLVSVKPDSELSEAINKMIYYDYSRLPVMQQEKRDLKGVISWRSIGQKLSFGQKSTKVRDLMEASYQLINADISLFNALPIIIEHDYVLVKNISNEICGIVTASDLSLQFKQLTEPFLLVSEIEKHIRQIVNQLGLEVIVNAKDERDTERKIEKVDDLNFGEYLRIFQLQENWNKLSLGLDRKFFCDCFEKVRDIRNTIMHFDPDGLDEKSIKILRDSVQLLQTLGVLKYSTK